MYDEEKNNDPLHRGPLGHSYLPDLSLYSYAAQLADSLSTHRLEEVQVTATRASAKTPMSFSNVSKGQLLKSNLGQDVPYLLLQTPSVVATSEPGIGIGYTYLEYVGSMPLVSTS